MTRARRAGAHVGLLVVGGGPASARQLVRPANGHHARVLVTSQLGGGLAVLDDQPLQSYVEELDVRAAGVRLRSYTDPCQVSPTGAEYTRYVRDVLRRSGVRIIPARVEDVWTEGALCCVALTGRGGEGRTLRARSVVLATGSTPREPPAEWRRLDALPVSAVYTRLARRRYDWVRGRSTLVVGGGNSAMQVAARLTPVARDVTILARRYVGMYPLETADRFAWRASSQAAYELVVKSAERCETGEGGLCLRFLVYDELRVEGDRVVYRYAAGRNTSTLGRASLPPRHGHLGRMQPGPGGWTETQGAGEPLIVWATGYEPAYPAGPTVARLPRDANGFIRHDEAGETAMRGLFLAGACAGYRAVNDMVDAGVEDEA